jgi:hypothetical protein
VRPRPDEQFHSVVCTDTAPAVNWQCQVLIHTWRAVAQPGEMVRLVAAPDGGPAPDHVHAQVVTTSAPNTHPETGDHYPPYNRLFSLLEWLQVRRPQGTVLILDPDMVFRHPITRTVTPGEVVVQPWLDFSPSSAPGELLSELTGIAGAELPAVTWPALVYTTDLERLLPRWIELTAELRQGLGLWESDMYAFVGALAELRPTVITDPLAAWLNWPEDAVAGAPLIHYCQAVEGRHGEQLWSKRTYRPWEPITVYPADARLDYCRDLLTILTDAVEAKSGRSGQEDTAR